MSRAPSEGNSPVKPFRTISGSSLSGDGGSGGPIEPLDLDEDKSSSEMTIPLVEGSPALEATRTESATDVPKMTLSGDATLD